MEQYNKLIVTFYLPPKRFALLQRYREESNKRLAPMIARQIIDESTLEDCICLLLNNALDAWEQGETKSGDNKMA